MARIAKSLKAPEQGYAHRDHRSRKGREKNKPYKKRLRHRLRRIRETLDTEHHEDVPVKMKTARKGKW